MAAPAAMTFLARPAVRAVRIRRRAPVGQVRRTLAPARAVAAEAPVRRVAVPVVPPMGAVPERAALRVRGLAAAAATAELVTTAAAAAVAVAVLPGCFQPPARRQALP
jgi:hypothetical protein